MFELSDGIVAELRILDYEIVCIEDRSHTAQRVSGDGSDLGFGCADQRKSCYRSTAQIVERHAHDAYRLARFAPRRPETIRGPRLVIAIGEDDGAALRCGIERDLERSADLYHYTGTGLALSQSDMTSVVG